MVNEEIHHNHPALLPKIMTNVHLEYYYIHLKIIVNAFYSLLKMNKMGRIN